MRRVTVLFAAFLLLATLSPAQDTLLGPRVSYEVDASQPAGGSVAIVMRVEGVRADSITVGMPVWRPGSYRIQNYPGRVAEFSAGKADGTALAVSHPRPDQWSVVTGSADPVVLHYTLQPGRAGDRGSEGLTENHFAVDGPGTFLYVVGATHVPHRATFRKPDAWRIATGLDSWAEDGTTWYGARDYDTFVDCPTEISDFTLREFTVGDALYHVMIHGETDWDVDGFVGMLQRIVESETGMFGGAPFRRYVFHFHFEPRMGGYGLEHLNSTSIYMPIQRVRQDVRTIASIAAHEFFHLWNVKRIRPARLGPFDYSREVRVRELWFCEGVTSYYATMTLERAGLTTERDLLDGMERGITMLESNPARATMSLEDSSWTVWEEGSGGGPRVNYYNKGEIVGWLLDLEMRRRTHGRVSLDDLMRFLYRWFVVGGGGPIGVGFQEGDLMRAASALTGTDFRDFFERYVAGTDDLPYVDVLGAAGYAVTLDVRESTDWGFGVNGARVERVIEGSPAAAAGLQAGDEIVGVNGEDVPAEGLRERLEGIAPGTETALRVRRETELREVRFTPSTRRVARCSIADAEPVSDDARGLRAAWLAGR